MRLAHPGRAEEADVGLLRDERQRREVPHLARVELRLEGEVEVT